MNCCDEYGDCRQGPDCPVRVARVKSRAPKHPAPLRHDISRVYLRHLAKWMLIILAVLLVSAAIVGVRHA
jgi:hypothetical protein